MQNDGLGLSALSSSPRKPRPQARHYQQEMIDGKLDEQDKTAEIKPQSAPKR
jgi:hypothetical protein